MGGADASTTFTDDKGLTWAANGNAQIDTSLGYNTGLFDGAGDYLTTAATVNLLATPFCVEDWLYMVAAPTVNAAILFAQDDGATNAKNNLRFYIDTGRKLSFVGWGSSSYSSFWIIDSGANLV
ncbi:MAG TPA: hypothetical protein VN017_04465, partial [Pseudoxanthomonas sp.]|nr:hypothetical protein [Pseudoxanthomonas sp.]